MAGSGVTDHAKRNAVPLRPTSAQCIDPRARNRFWRLRPSGAVKDLGGFLVGAALRRDSNVATRTNRGVKPLLQEHQSPFRRIPVRRAWRLLALSSKAPRP